MKTIFRFLNLGLLIVAFTAAGVVSVTAQDTTATPPAEDPRCTAEDAAIRELYGKFSKDIDAKVGLDKATTEQRQSAVSAGKEFLEKYGTCKANWAAQITYMTQIVQGQEKVIAAAPRLAILNRYDAAVGAKKWDEAFAAGNEFVAKYPADPIQTNIIIPLAYVGVIESDKKNYKYNEDSIKYAKIVINKLNAGEKPVKGDLYGSLGFGGTKDDVVSDLNYAIAYMTYHAKNDKKGALPYYYEVAQKPGRKQKDPRVYGTIADYYLEQRKPIGKEIADLITRQKAATTDEEKLTLDTEIKAKIGLAKGYIEREMDALSRARNVTPDTPATKAYRDGVYTELKSLYEQRFEKKDGLDTYIAATIAKPMPNPTTDVTPVSEAVPTTGTTTNAPVTAKPAVVPAKPVSASTTKVSVTEITAAPSTTATMGKTKTAAKKPVVRRKRS
ncbi:MAG: hypothetical protein WKF92_04530 [Pyrinomonadaceae bacterium]